MFGKTGSPQGKQRVPSPLLVLAGIIAPIIFVLVFTIDGLLRPGYSPSHQMISDH
jgi:hypothetical membrane protein